MRANWGMRPSLKSSLLVGAAGVAASVGATGAFAADDATPPPKFSKFLPYAQVGSREGDSQSTGNVTLFMPAMQALNKLLYLKLGGELQTSNGRFEQIGVGYRQKILPTWIVGGFAFYDEERTKHGNTFSQIEIGAELLNPNWEFHATNYSIAHNGVGPTGGIPKIKIDGNTISLEQQIETPYSGFEGHGSYKIFKTPFTDLRLYAGGFRFTPDSNFDHRPIQGPKGGFEYNIYDLDLLGPQSRLQFQGEVRHDDVRHSSGFVSVTLRIPLNIGDDSGQGPQTLDELDRRMVDDPNPAGGGNILVEQTFGKPEPVIVYGQNSGRTEPTNSIFYVDNSKGAGTYQDPTDFVDATTRGGSNALFVLTDFEGDVHEPGNLSSGDIVAGGGTTLTVKGAQSGLKVTHTFAPGVHNPVVDVPQGQTAITLADHVALYDFAIHGAFGTAIYGHNPGVVTAHGITIQGEGGESGQTGIHIRQDNSTTLDFLGDNLAISDVDGTGIYIDTSLSSGYADEHIALNAPIIANVGRGIHFNTDVSGNGSVTQHFDIEDAQIDGTAGYGINIESFAGGEGAIAQTGAINNADISNTNVGIGIYSAANGGSLTQTISIDPTHITSSGNAFLVGGYAYNSGSLIQTISANGLTIDGSENDGIFVYGIANSSGSVTQTVSLSDVTINDSGRDGLRITADAASNGTVNQGFQVDGLTIDGAGEDGIHIEGTLQDATIDQDIDLNNVTVEGVANRGVFVYARAGGEGGEYGGGEQGGEGGEFGPFDLGHGGDYGTFQLTQRATFNNAQIQSTGDAIDIRDRTGAYASSEQYVAFTGDSSLESAQGGVSAYVSTNKYARAHQIVGLPDITLTAPQGGAAYIQASAYYTSHIDQYVLIDSITTTNAAPGLGISIGSTAEEGSSISQQVVINGGKISSATADGADISIFSNSGATVQQTVTLANIDVSGNLNGIYASDYSSNAIANQIVTLNQVTANNEIDKGVALSAITENGTTLQHAYIDGLQASHNGGAGLYIYNHANGGVVGQYAVITNSTFNYDDVGVAAYALGENTATTLQKISIDGSSLRHNITGLSASNEAKTGASTEQRLSIGNDTIDNNTGDEIDIYASADGASFATEYLYLHGNSSVSSNGGMGINIASYASNGGNVEQNVIIYDTDIDSNTGDGIAMSAHSYSYREGYAQGYYYFSHITLNANIEYGSISNNTGDGISFDINADGYGGAIDTNIYLYGETVRGNTKNGIYHNVNVGAYSTTTEHVYVVGSDVGGNSGNGFYAKSNAAYQSVLYDYIYITDSHLDGNTGSGFVEHDYAQGIYSQNFQTTTISNSTFNDNGATGATFYSGQNYGPGGFGVADQVVSIGGSDFSHNAGDGLRLEMNSTGNQGRAEQHFTIHNSTFTDNGGDGMHLYRYAAQGVYVQGYPCTTVQGLPGGCAFDRQTMYVYDSDFSHNIGDGIYVGTVANHYGAAYGLSARAVSPTLYLDNTTATYNERDGLEIKDRISDNSYLYENIVAINSHFDHNGRNGIYTDNQTTGNSTTIQYIYLDGSTADDNAGNGIKIQHTAEDTSYVYSGVQLVDTEANRNGGNGVSFDLDANGGRIVQYVTADTLTANGNGVYGLIANANAINGGVSIQTIAITNSTFDNNIGGGEGSYGAGASFSAYAGGEGSLSSQDVTIDGSEASGNITGFHFSTYAADEGYAAQHATLTGTTATGNSQSGARFDVSEVGGAQIYGQAAQYVTLNGGDFSHNGGDGVYFGAHATGKGARTAQYITIDGTTASNNGRDGMRLQREATQGALTYGYGGESSYALTCDSVQGYNGGCAVVHQTVNVAGSDFSHNTGNGISLLTSAGVYGSIYGESGIPREIPTFSISGSTVSDNGGNGFFISNNIADNSFSYQYVSAVDTAFDRNATHGVYVSSYAHANAQIVENVRLYVYAGEASASGNGGDGIRIDDKATTGSQLNSGAYVGYLDIGSNGATGISLSDTGDSTSYSGQNLSATYDNVSSNARGLFLHASGAGADQESSLTSNSITDNTNEGVRGVADTNAYQYVSVYDVNTVTGNAPDYSFDSYTGASQIVN